MKHVARSGVVLDYIRRVKYVVIGSSMLWCQCTVCFALTAILDRPLSPATWIVFHSGTDLLSAGTGFLYYSVIGEWRDPSLSNEIYSARKLKETKRFP